MVLSGSSGMTAKNYPSVCDLNHRGTNHLVAQLVTLLKHKGNGAGFYAFRVNSADAVMYIGVKCISCSAV